MTLVALGVIGIMVAVSVVFYSLVRGEPVALSAIDCLLIAVCSLLGVTLAVVASRSVAYQIVSPVRSLADAARRIAGNDLTARANEPDDTLGELRDLAKDFNVMAARLETLAGERRHWREGVSHELRTPLTILRGQIQGGLDGVYAREDELFHLALGQIETMASVISDFRAMEDDSLIPFRPETVALDGLMREVRGLMDAALRSADFETEWRIDQVSVRGDPMRLRQACIALLQNVLMHAVPGKVRISLTATDDKAFITVEDSGPGVPAELYESLFEPFERGPTAAPGTGVGLAVVRMGAEGHGGRASLTASTLGGSRFELEIPVGGAATV